MGFIERSRFVRTRKLIFIPIAYLAFLAIVTSASYYIGHDIVKKPVKSTINGTSFYTLPIISMNTIVSKTGRGELRLGVNLEVGADDIDRIENYVPFIVERIQTYMNRISVEEIRNNPALRWLRNDLLYEINKVTGPIRILGIRLRELVVTQ